MNETWTKLKTARAGAPVHARSSWQPVYAQLLREWLTMGEPAWLPLTGSSMRPFLPDGTKVLVAPMATARLSLGTLVVYEIDDRIVCHRILGRHVERRRQAFLTKGDHWRTLATWIPETRILGVVVAIERNGRLYDLRTHGRRFQAFAVAAMSWVIARSWR